MEEIQDQELLVRGDPQMINTLSRELHGLLYKKTKQKARTHVEALDVHRGVEALRAIRFNLFRKDAKRLKSQFDELTNLQPIKPSEMRLFPALLTARAD